MKKIMSFLLVTVMVVMYACSQENPGKKEEFVYIEGGTFVNEKSNYYDNGAVLSSFYIGKYEVTQEKWVDVMGSNPSQFIGDNLPVEMISWYDAIEYCIARSIKEGLNPYYNIDKTTEDLD